MKITTQESKPPLLIRLFQCPRCTLKKKQVCTYWRGFIPPMFLVTLGIFRNCMMQNQTVPAPSFEPPLPSRTEQRMQQAARANMERRSRSEIPYSKHFKGKGKHGGIERTLWKSGERPEKDDDLKRTTEPR